MSNLSLEQCYQLLELSPGADLEAVEAAYARKIMIALREKSPAQRSTEQTHLKHAYNRLKEHTLQQAYDDDQAVKAANTPEQKILDLLQQRLLQRSRPQSHQRSPSHEPTIQIKIQNNELRVMLDVRIAPTAKTTSLVYTTLKTLDLPDIKTLIVYGMRGGKSVIWKKQYAIAPKGLTKDDLDPYSFNSRLNNAAAFPLVFLLVAVLNSFFLTQWLLMPFHIWIHEFGHAIVAWLAGRRALPLPFGWTSVSMERSLFVYFGILILMGLFFWSGWREQKRAPMVFAIVVLPIQFYMTWIMPEETFDLWLSFGGIGGEFYLSTLFMISFYFPLPERWRWDFCRYIVLIWAASTFWESFWQWHHIVRGESSIPWGSIFGGEGDAGGDMNQLSLIHGWSDQQIINTYSHLGNLCLFILSAIYFYFLLKQNHRFLFNLQHNFNA
jgi:hypothetical protein